MSQVKVSHLDKESKPILELKNLSIDFGGLRAVDDVNLSIYEGELRSFIGPNGAGKSTVFKLIMGLYRQTSGEIFFEGNEISKIPTWQRSRNGISIKMQIPGVFGELTAYDNMRIALQNYVKGQEIDQEIKKLSELVGIEHLMNQTVNNLSHGQQQWLEIAMSLGSTPRLLLLDEPAAGMGPEETHFTAEIVNRLRDSGITIIFIDHDMGFVRQISKSVTVLNQGSVFKEGSIEEIESDEEVIEIYLGTNEH